LSVGLVVQVPIRFN